jgi:hypothetical protein
MRPAGALTGVNNSPAGARRDSPTNETRLRHSAFLRPFVILLESPRQFDVGIETHHVFGAQSGSGEFASGTGRFQGITGKVTFVGQLSGSVSEKDWVGS